MFRTGDVVVCIRTHVPKMNYHSLIKPIPIGPPCEEKKIYNVRKGADYCGCGRRILLEEIQTDHSLINGSSTVDPRRAVYCASCGVTLWLPIHKEVEIGYFYRNFRKLTSIGELEGKEFSVPLPVPAEKKSIMTPKPQVEFSK